MAPIASSLPGASDADSARALLATRGAAAKDAIDSRMRVMDHIASTLDKLRFDPAVSENEDGNAMIRLLTRMVADYGYSGVVPQLGLAATPPSSPPPAQPRSPQTPVAELQNLPPSSPPLRSYAAAAATPAPAPSAHKPLPKRRRPAPTDLRVMVRLSDDANARLASAAFNLTTAKSVLGAASPSLRTVQIVPSGLALVPTDPIGRSHILDAAEKIQATFLAQSVEEQTSREDFMNPYVPLSLASGAPGQKPKSPASSPERTTQMNLRQSLAPAQFPSVPRTTTRRPPVRCSCPLTERPLAPRGLCDFSGLNCG